MKGLLRAGIVLLLLVTVFCVGRLWSRDKTEPPAPRTRVALVNLTYVVKNCDEYKEFQKETNEILADFGKRIETKREEAKVLKAKTSDQTKTDEEAFAAAADLNKVQKDLAALENQLKKILAKKSDEQMVILYKDIQSASERYAKAHDIELVLRWNEATTEDDLWSPANVARKMQAGNGTCMPVYVAPGMDITKEIVAILNDK